MYAGLRGNSEERDVSSLDATVTSPAPDLAWERGRARRNVSGVFAIEE